MLNCPTDFHISVVHLVREPSAYINSVKNHYGNINFIYRLVEWFNSYCSINRLMKNYKNNYSPSYGVKKDSFIAQINGYAPINLSYEISPI